MEFFIDLILLAALWALGLTKPFNRNEYLEYYVGDKGGRCVGLTALPPACADCQEIWDLQSPGTTTASAGLTGIGYSCYCHYCSYLWYRALSSSASALHVPNPATVTSNFKSTFVTLRRRSMATRLLVLWVRIPPGT